MFEFARKSQRIFGGGIYYTRGYSPESPAQFVQRSLPKRLERRGLLILDEADELPEDWYSELAGIIALQNLALLMAARSAVHFPQLQPQLLLIPPLHERAFRQLIAKHMSKGETGVAKKLWNTFKGNPLVATVAAEFLRSQRLTLAEFAEALQTFTRPGIVGPDGRPISPTSTKSKQIVTEVTEVNEHLLDVIRSDPSVFYALGSRRFEEVVAELMIRQGYQVTLTPASKDGGFDMYAARKDTLGEFLFLVECKKYAPEHKVGVQIVRALHGVVQNQKATAGVIATTSFFTRGAKEFREDVAHQMKLADYVELQKWLACK